MNQRLQHAFENEPVPRDLEAQVCARLAASAPGGRWAGWRRALAGGAGLLAEWILYGRFRRRVARVSRRPAVMRKAS